MDQDFAKSPGPPYSTFYLVFSLLYPYLCRHDNMCVEFRHQNITATALIGTGRKCMQFVLGISAMSTSDIGGMRPVLLLLLIVAVILLLLGCSIALLTLRNQRKDYLAFITIEKSDSDREKY